MLLLLVCYSTHGRSELQNAYLLTYLLKNDGFITRLLKDLHRTSCPMPKNRAPKSPRRSRLRRAAQHSHASRARARARTHARARVAMKKQAQQDESDAPLDQDERQALLRRQATAARGGSMYATARGTSSRAIGIGASSRSMVSASARLPSSTRPDALSGVVILPARSRDTAGSRPSRRVRSRRFAPACRACGVSRVIADTRYFSQYSV